MQTIPVQSSNLKAIAYDKERKYLEVTFLKGDRAYGYENVPEETIHALLAAPSKGSYFSKNIRNTFMFKKL